MLPPTPCFMKPGMPCKKSASLSLDAKYRYWLYRRWEDKRPTLCFVMLNPSTADASVDDPTICKCCYYAGREGFGGIEVFNLFAVRATDPAEIRRAADPVGPKGDQVLRDFARRHRNVVIAWGVDGRLFDRDLAVVKMLSIGRPETCPLFCLGQTKGGLPKHPLYLPNDEKLRPYVARGTVPAKEDPNHG